MDATCFNGKRQVIPDPAIRWHGWHGPDLGPTESCEGKRPAQRASGRRNIIIPDTGSGGGGGVRARSIRPQGPLPRQLSRHADRSQTLFRKGGGLGRAMVRDRSSGLLLEYAPIPCGRGAITVARPMPAPLPSGAGPMLTRQARDGHVPSDSRQFPRDQPDHLGGPTIRGPSHALQVAHRGDDRQGGPGLG